jgi:hypothetical protein
MSNVPIDASRRWYRYLPVGTSATGYRVIDQQYDDCPNDCNDHAIEIEAGNAACAKLCENKASDKCTDNAEDDVEKETRACFVNDLAGDEAGYKSKHDPADDRRCAPLLL